MRRTWRPSTPGADVRRTVATMLAVLGAWGSAVAVHEWAGMPLQDVVLAVVLALTGTRVLGRGGRAHPASLVELPVIGLAAAGVGWLLVERPWIGGPLFVAGLSAGILTRRFGPATARAGRLLALPFLALLITPVPQLPGENHLTATAWAPVGSVLAVGWIVLVDRVLPGWAATGGPAAAPRPAPRGSAPGGPASRRRLDAPTRMALQMAVGLGVALMLGHLLFHDRWAWTVLSAFVVQSGNRGRGEVVHKAGLRLVGALAGTALATLVAGAVPSGHRASLVVLFAVMALAVALRPHGYAWWAAGVTAMVAVVHGYFGESGTSVLGERLLGVLLGSAIGVAAAWFVTPVRTRDVLRRRLLDVLAAATDDLGAPAGELRTRHALAALDDVAPVWRAHARVRGIRGGRPVAAIDAAHRLVPLPADPGARRRLRGGVVRVRRAVVGRDRPTEGDLEGPLGAVHGYLERSGRGARIP